MALAVGEKGKDRTMRRTLSDGNEIRGGVVEVVLPKGREKGDCDSSSVKSRPKKVMLKAQPVCLQVGDDNTIDLFDLTMQAYDSDGPTKVSDDEELVIRVLRRYGSFDELVLGADSRNLRQELDIHADFVRIITPADEKSKVEQYNLAVEVKSCKTLMIGNKNKFVIQPEDLPNVFDNTQPVFRVIRLPTKPVAVVKNAKEFPNIEKDHLIVLAICENRFTIRAVGCSFPQSSSLAKSKKMKDFYEVKISVSQCEKNGKTEVRDGVLFQRESGLDCLQGLVGYWFRFQTAKTRYIVTFSLWKTVTDTLASELLDEARIAVETSERKIPPRRLAARTRTHVHKQSAHKVASLPVRNRKVTSFPEGSGTSPMKTSISEKCQAVEETSLPVEKISIDCIDQSCFHTSNMLLSLLNDGNWDEFNQQAANFLKEFANNVDFQVIVNLDQSMASSYRGELSAAERIIKEAIRIIPKASSALRPLFKARASYYLAGIYRRDKKIGEAQRCVDSAKKHISSSKAEFPLEEARIAYEEGCLLLERALRPRECVVEQAKQAFDRCIGLCSCDSKEETNNFLWKQHDLARMKKAMLLLDCHTTSGRKDRSIDEKSLIEARLCLDRLKINIVEEMSKFAQTQYHLVRSDQYFREGRFVDTDAHARKALDLSRTYHFDIGCAANGRLEHYSKILNCD